MNSLNINILFLLLIVLINITLWFVSIRLMKTLLEKFLLYITLVLGTFFSSAGIFTDFTDNYRYLFPFLFFWILLVSSLVISTKLSKEKLNESSYGVFLNHKTIFIILGITAFALHFSKIIYPEFMLLNLFDINRFYFSGDTFSTRIAQREDFVYNSFSTLATIMMPFFFILLYCIKNKPILFISLTILYPYISFVHSNYIGRNEIILWLIIILFYLYSEKIIKKKALVILSVVLGLTIIPVLNYLFFLRQGLRFENQGIIATINEFLRQEAISQKYLFVAEQFASELSFIAMISRWLLKLIPIVPEIDFPVLSYAFSSAILGVEYGGKDYYILLPGAFGEGVMMLGIWGAGFYGVFIAIFVSLIFNWSKKIPFLKFWLVYFILNYGLAFRGGFQTFFSQFFYSSIMVIIVLFILKITTTNNRRFTKQNNLF
ncbi:oligosaccharide repeat unit polymerase [Planococcus maritimus]|uniref:Oligosaccharide repeat unit polymerase n=1 Tax=Planococcus maritimus TaxID=192421 RepID=A0A7D7R8W8_PLAMR|nr:O-antigen polymerase [Planococcus maritimus]QMT16758.1 oligosaccharide repeat unit polymerase [Planococcus maritimus]